MASVSHELIWTETIAMLPEQMLGVALQAHPELRRQFQHKCDRTAPCRVVLSHPASLLLRLVEQKNWARQLLTHEPPSR